MSEHTNGTARLAQADPAIDIAGVRELLGMMKATFGQLDQTVRTLNDQSSKVAELGPSMETAERQLAALRLSVTAQDTKQEDRIAGIKLTIKEGIKLEAQRDMEKHIKDQIQSEILKQVKEQIALQMPTHLPVPLPQHAEESRQALSEVQNALANSKARLANSRLHPSTHPKDKLELVLNPDGKKSKVYPPDLCSLLAYDASEVQQLVTDFGLRDLGAREKNLNRVLAHIGIRGVDIQPDVMAARTPASGSRTTPVI